MFHQNEMAFRLGRDWDPEDAGVRNWSRSALFGTNSKMEEWYCISAKDSDLWPNLAARALSRLLSEN